MPGKRQRVPAVLHSELQEYSSLLRALRTSSTLDLASQLTQHASASSSQHGSAQTRSTTTRPREVDDSTHISDANDDGDDDPVTRRLKRKAKGKEESQTTVKSTRDSWTRWPLLAGDVYVPEWSLEDEVRSIALRCLKSSPSNTLANTNVTASSNGPDNVQNDAESDPEDDDYAETLLTPTVLDALACSTGRHLAQILALLAAYVPPSEKSMQNRFKPLNWETVLEIAAVHGLVDNAFVSCLQFVYVTTY